MTSKEFILSFGWTVSTYFTVSAIIFFLLGEPPPPEPPFDAAPEILENYLVLDPDPAADSINLRNSSCSIYPFPF
jgi:hypothetical protein